VFGELFAEPVSRNFGASTRMKPFVIGTIERQEWGGHDPNMNRPKARLAPENRWIVDKRTLGEPSWAGKIFDFVGVKTSYNILRYLY
jgi:hypothetical protein